MIRQKLANARFGEWVAEVAHALSKISALFTLLGTLLVIITVIEFTELYIFKYKVSLLAWMSSIEHRLSRD